MKSPQIRRDEAAKRKFARVQRSTAQQIALINRRPGQSKRERARLEKI